MTEELRGFIRFALFALHTNRGNASVFVAASSIVNLGFDKATLAKSAPTEAHQLLASMVPKIADLRLESETSPASLSQILIEINAKARSLSAALGHR